MKFFLFLLTIFIFSCCAREKTAAERVVATQIESMMTSIKIAIDLDPEFMKEINLKDGESQEITNDCVSELRWLKKEKMIEDIDEYFSLGDAWGVCYKVIALKSWNYITIEVVSAGMDGKWSTNDDIKNISRFKMNPRANQ